MDLSINQHQKEPETSSNVIHNDEGKQVEQDEAPQKLWKGKKHIKKVFYEKIMNQMEFYFSASNLAKDRFMSQLIQEDPCKLHNILREQLNSILFIFRCPHLCFLKF